MYSSFCPTGGLMKKSLFIILFFTSYLGWSDVIRSPIHSLDKTMIRFENGRVAFIDSNEKLLSDQLTEAAIRKDLIEVKIDNEQSLISVQTIEERPSHLKRMNLMEDPAPITFEPTVIPGYSEALKLFNRLNTNWVRSSECSNRAHIWAFEEFKTNNLKSQKAFVFFTASYINRNRFKWWFHVAPLFTIKENSGIEKRVFDVMFTDRPVTIKEWTDNFVFSKRPCKLTTKFSEYDVNPQTEDCYFIISPMYYWTPTDISNEETQNRFKRDFNQGEIRAAYSEAF